MKNKIVKIITIIVLLITLTTTNFIYVGTSIYSYAISNIKTNHQNVEFEAYFKEGEQKNLTAIERGINEKATLILQITVKKEGYFNGNLTLENSNFKWKEAENNYINKIEENKITLNQINAGETAQIEIEVEPIKEEKYDIGLLNKTSEINLEGTYKDSTEKDIKIEATREISLKIAEENSEENIEKEMEIITNKILKINGENKRVIQIKIKQGLKENNYPIKEIETKIEIPEIGEKQAKVEEETKLNTMTKYEYQYENGIAQITLKNEEQENKIQWKEQGEETTILTCIYEEDTDIENQKIKMEETITLQNEKQIKASNEITLTNEEKDNIIEVNSKNSETSIYKGKLYEGIEKEYETTTTVKVNLAEAIEEIKIKENQDEYTTNEETNKTTKANVEYKTTTIKKEQIEKILGETGTITIKNEKDEEIAKIENTTQANEKGEIEIEYGKKAPKAIKIITTKPIAEGELEFKHTKTIKQEDKTIIKTAQKIQTKTTYKYSQGIEQETQAKTELLETTTQAKLEINKTELSTIITNNVEIKATLQTNNEKYDLYKNPTITIELPKEVEEITIEDIDTIYNDELSIKKYKTEGNKIKVELEGEQTKYKEATIEGAEIRIKANIKLNRKTTSKETQIKMTYQNEKANTYAKESIEERINIVAPTEVTTINSIKDLSIETIGSNEKEKVTIARGEKAKQAKVEIEVINNEQTAIKNVKIIGQFPTDNQTNNMGIKIIKELEKIENATIYYTENEEATEDAQNSKNGWKTEITNNEKIKKYLIEIEEISAQNSITTNYTIEIPENLEYNKIAEENYKVSYTNEQTQAEKEITATAISLETGIGPVIDVNLTASKNGKTIEASDTVKNGEVIQYQLKIENTGSQNIENLQVIGEVPEGTAIVEPEENYEYTGASYYKELEKTEYTEQIETLEVGETKTITYQVRVKTETEEGRILTNKMKVSYLDITKETNEIQTKTEKGDLRVSVKRVTNKEINMYNGSSIRYYAIIENISDEVQKDVKVKTNLSEDLIVKELHLITGMRAHKISTTEDGEGIIDEGIVGEGEEKVTSTQLEYQEELNIGDIAVGENKVLIYDLEIKGDESIQFFVDVNDEYQSNIWEDEVNSFEIKLNMTSETEGENVKAGDIIKYTIEVENVGKSPSSGLIIEANIPQQLTVKSVKEYGREREGTLTNNIYISSNIESNEKEIIEVEAIVDNSLARDKAEVITAVAKAEVNGKTVATSEVSHIILANSETSTNPENPDSTTGEEDNNNNEVPDNGIATGNKTITGTAWYDSNANGKKDEGEQLLSNIKVKLLNIETNSYVKDKNGKEIEVTTNDKGIYILENIGNGKYIVIFEYDKTQYTLTTYKVEGASETENSDVIKSELLIGNEKKEVAGTDIIEIANKNVSGINIGLIKLQNFDLQLEKYVSKIIIQDATGTTVREYNQASLAKVEIDRKTVNGATAIIEYQIKVTNVGEVEGYVKKIADYAPESLKFSSELNKDWYQTGGTLYNASLANEVIKAGESRTVTLTLTKALTGENVGAFNNTAEIAEDYNTLGIEDSNSTPGNKTRGENDMGTADIILSIKTGGTIIYITIIIVAILSLGIVGYIIIRKNKKEEQKNKLDKTI